LSRRSAKSIAIPFEVDAETEQQARAIRARRDLLYQDQGIRISSKPGRWVGDAGEIIFNRYLNMYHAGELVWTWMRGNAIKDPDFKINGRNVELKTRNSAITPKPYSDYCVSVAEFQAKEYRVDDFVFLAYEKNERTMWLLGVATWRHFLARRVFCREGEAIHPKYTALTDCWVLQYPDDLFAVGRWADEIKKRWHGGR
jgi:hypothetical protein